MTTGKVKWFNADKGFGVIEPKGGGDDIVVQRSAIVTGHDRLMRGNQAVEFDVQHGASGPEAINVHALGPLEGPGAGGGDDRPQPRA